MPKIVALACSPSKGFNSDTMLDAFLAGISEIKEVKVEKIYLNDVEMQNYNFLNRLPDAAKEPQLVALIDKIVSADGVVVATPCFNFGVPAVLKNLLDRMSYKALNPKSLNWLSQPKGLLTNLHNFYLVSCGTPGWMVRAFLWPIFPVNWLRVVFGYFGSKTWGGIYGAGLNTNNLAKNNPKLLERCRKAGRGYAQRLVKLLA